MAVQYTVAAQIYLDYPCHFTSCDCRYVYYNLSNTAFICIGILYTGLIIRSDVFLGGHDGALTASLDQISSCVTTVLATSLIALKIILTTRQSQMRHSYSKIIATVVEAATPVSILLLALTVLALVGYAHPYKLNTTRGSFFFQMFQYLLLMQGPVTACISFSITCA